MDFSFTEEQMMLQQNLRRFVSKECPDELVRKWDENREYPYALYDKIVDMGLIGLPFPEVYGGTDGSAIDMLIVGEEMGRKGYDLAAMYGLPIFNALNVLHWGTQEQKDYYISGVIQGKLRLSICITEPNAGSDVGGIKTVATREGDTFILNGQKVFATGAHLKNNTMVLFARTDLNVSHHNGLSAFLVDSTLPGIEIRRLDTLGRRIVTTNEVFLTNVRIPEDKLLGPLNGGWQVLLSGLDLERLFTSCAYVGNAQTAVDETLEYAKQRVQFGKPIGDFQAIAHMLANIQTEVDAARLLTYRAGWMLSNGQPCVREVSMAKLFGSEAFVRATEVGMQVMGGYGYVMEYNMQRHFRDARIVTITAGSSQMQRNIIARSMGLRPK
jgi:alkylation response protein AidB-like acyl-CoA dehydrogenase